MDDKNAPIQLWRVQNDPIVVNGHLRWSSWAQRRLLHIGLPLAGLIAVLSPLAMIYMQPSRHKDLYLNSTRVNHAASPAQSATYANTDDPTVQANPMGNLHQVKLTVNGKDIPLHDNGTTDTTINDVGSTTHVFASSSSNATSDETGSTNNSSVNIHVDSAAGG